MNNKLDNKHRDKRADDQMDKILCYTLAGGQARAYVAKTTNMVRAAQSTHGLSPVAAVALGRAIAFTAIMAVQMKGEEDRLSIIVKGDGPLGSITTAARSDGSVKGFVDNPGAQVLPTPEGRLNVGAAVGKEGRITVVKDLGMKEPYVGNVALQTGELGDDFAYYLLASEQQPSAVALGVLLRDGQIASAGGILLSPLPGCSEEVLTFLENSAPLIADVSSLFEGNSAEDVGEILFYPIQHKLEGEFFPEYKCDCSRERLEGVLRGIDNDELQDMIEKQGGAQVVCHFCRSEYDFSAEELDSFIKQR
ncbi:MAG: Hsp33 family molecular chaperone HslO [Christensenellales bacterium]|jgi:molecular chaperone Hsp33